MPTDTKQPTAFAEAPLPPGPHGSVPQPEPPSATSATRDKPTTNGHTLPELPRGWLLASIEVRRDEAWCYSARGPLTYDALIERGDSMEATGSGPTPAAAVRAALDAMEADEAAAVERAYERLHDEPTWVMSE